jgi:hypothetical protein
MLKKGRGNYKIIIAVMLFVAFHQTAQCQSYPQLQKLFSDAYVKQDYQNAIKYGVQELDTAKRWNILHSKVNYQIAASLAEVYLINGDTTQFLKFADLFLEIASWVGEIYDPDLARYYRIAGNYYIDAGRADRAFVSFDLGESYSLAFIPDSEEYYNCSQGIVRTYNKIDKTELLSDGAVFKTLRRYQSCNPNDCGYRSKLQLCLDLLKVYESKGIVNQPQSLYIFPI